MKLEDVSQPRLKFFAGHLNDDVYSFAVRFVGKDGHGRDVWAGSIRRPSGMKEEVAIVVDHQDEVLAIHAGEQSQKAAETVVSLRRRAYGPSATGYLSWSTYSNNRIKLENYEAQ